MGIISGMFLFAFRVIGALKCEAVIFPKFESAGIPIRLFEYLDVFFNYSMCVMPARVRCTCLTSRHKVSIMCKPRHHDVNSIHVPYVPLGMRWHDIIGVHVVGTPHHYGMHRMGMT